MASTIPVIPLPAKTIITSGQFEVSKNTHVVVANSDVDATKTAVYFTDLLNRTRRLSLPVNQHEHGQVAITFRHDVHSPVTNSEGYVLDVTPRGITITARTDAGLFYGAITLWQLLTPDAQHGTVRVPALHIEDQPRFAWRGLMLDSARHFQSVADVESLLDQMAQHKLNVLHWHLTDDQGWRIEIKRYPQLTNVGAWRTPPFAGDNGEPTRYGGFYTQDQIRAVVAYAAARHITVVPELDMPGHAQAAVASYPQLGVTGKQPLVSIDWGVNPYLYNVDDASFQFIDNVLDEVMTLFPSHYIHLGGDEAIKDQWKASPVVQAKMRALKIKDEDALQGWFMARVGNYLAQHGRRLVGWDEILDGGVPADATVMSWRGTEGALKAAKLGHDVVLSPTPELYFDGVQGARADEVAGRIPVHDLADVYAFEPVPKQLDVAQARHVLGAQANVWTEHMPTMQHVDIAIFPRVDALSEMVWSPVSARNWKSFLTRLPAQLGRYDAQSIAHSDSAFAVNIDTNVTDALKTKSATVTLSNQVAFGAIHYTVDGSEPNAASALYRLPFAVALPVTVRAVAYSDNGSALASTRSRELSRDALLSLSGTELPNCPGSDFRLRLQPTPDAASLHPAYPVNIFDACQMYPSTPMDGVVAIHAEVARLARNFALAHDAKLVVSRPSSTPYGELVVHLDRCDGATVATMPLPNPTSSARTFALDAAFPSQSGAHALCLIFTAPINGPLYAFDRVALKPSAKKP